MSELIAIITNAALSHASLNGTASGGVGLDLITVNFNKGQEGFFLCRFATSRWDDRTRRRGLPFGAIASGVTNRMSPIIDDSEAGHRADNSFGSNRTTDILYP